VKSKPGPLGPDLYSHKSAEFLIAAPSASGWLCNIHFSIPSELEPATRTPNTECLSALSFELSFPATPIVWVIDKKVSRQYSAMGEENIT